MDLDIFGEYKAAKAANETKRAARLLNKLVADNMPLASKFVDKLVRRGAVGERDDLLQAAAIGIMKAIEVYDPTVAKFSTFAFHKVRDEVQKASVRDGVIYKPRGSGLPYQAHRAAERVYAKEGREATAEEMGVTEEALARWEETPFVVPAAEHMPGQASSRENLCWEDTFADETPNAEERLTEDELTSILRDAWSRLNERERRVMSLMFFHGKTFKEIAVLEDRHQESIRLYYHAALAKMQAVVSK